MTDARVSRWPDWLAALGVGAAAFALRLYYVIAAVPEVPLRADATQYFRIALNVVRWGVFSTADPAGGAPLPDSYRGPGYPTLIALFLEFTGSVPSAYIAILVLQALLGACSAVMIFRLTRGWLGARWALAAGTLVAVWPHLIVQDGLVLTESSFGFLLVAAVCASQRWLATGRVGWGVAAGTAFGVAALVNSMITLFPPMLLILCRKRAGWVGLLLFAALSLLPPVVWEVRDTLVASPYKSAGGRLFENILMGLEPQFADWYRNQQDPDALAARKRVGEGSTLYYRDKSAAYALVASRVAAEPGRYFLWFLRKPFALWSWGVGQGAGDIYVYRMVESPFETNPALRILVALCRGANFLLMISAFAGSLWVAWRIGWRGGESAPLAAALIAAVFAYGTAVYTVLTPDARYANPFRPFELALGVHFLSVASGWLVQLRNSRGG